MNSITAIREMSWCQPCRQCCITTPSAPSDEKVGIITTLAFNAIIQDLNNNPAQSTHQGRSWILCHWRRHHRQPRCHCLQRDRVHSNHPPDRNPGRKRYADIPVSKVHGANMGPTWVLVAPGGPHVGPMNFAIWDHNMETLFALLLMSNLH